MGSPNSAPDVAHSSWDFPEGTGVGESRNPSDLVSQGLDLKTSTLQRLRFRFKSGLPSVVSASNIKEAFVSLLEYAEECLGCTHVIVCIDKRQSNSATKMAIRNFLFLGFQPLAPRHEYNLPSNPDVVCFLYTI